MNGSKRIITCLTALILLLGMLCGCGAAPAAAPVPEAVVTASPVTPEPETPAPVARSLPISTPAVETPEALPERSAVPEAAPAETETPAAECTEDVFSESVTVADVDVAAEMIPLADAAPVPFALEPKASGTVVYSAKCGEIDASNTADGYVMCRYTGTEDKRLKVMVSGPSGTAYYYNLNLDGAFETFPLSDGSGQYTLAVCQNVTGTKYMFLVKQTVTVTLKDEFAPFLRPNQYVNFSADSAVVKKAAELTAGKAAMLDKVTAVYDYVVKNFSYDTQKAQTVQSGYLPDVDAILACNKGICFDYAAVMAAMLRSQGIPTKLVVGYAGQIYHAWISTWSEESGWVDGVIFFDGSAWKLMDPTFASTGNRSDAVMQYIGNGSNYTSKYLY